MLEDVQEKPLIYLLCFILLLDCIQVLMRSKAEKVLNSFDLIGSLCYFYLTFDKAIKHPYKRNRSSLLGEL